MLPLPLHCYDDAGRVKPPRWLYWLICLGCRDIFLVLMSLVFPDQTEILLGLLYQDGTEMLLKIGFASPFVAVLLLISYHSVMLNKQWIAWIRVLKPLLVIGLLASLFEIIADTTMSGGHFSLYASFGILFNSFALVCIVRSRHLKIMLNDWRKDARDYHAS